MKYKINICKKTNVVTIELFEDMNKDMMKEFKENKIHHVTERLIHFRLNDNSNVLNKMIKFPKALQIIEKHGLSMV